MKSLPMETSAALTFFLHAHSNAFSTKNNRTMNDRRDRENVLPAAIAALIALVLVDSAVILMATFVDRILADAPSKEAFATVARNRTVMFACVKSRGLLSDWPPARLSSPTCRPVTADHTI